MDDLIKLRSELTGEEKRALTERVVECARVDLNGGKPLTETRHESGCDCPFHRLTEAEQVALIDRAIDLTNAEVIAHGGYLPLTFADDWELAPAVMTRTTERECAEGGTSAGDELSGQG